MVLSRLPAFRRWAMAPPVRGLAPRKGRVDNKVKMKNLRRPRCDPE